MKGSIRAQGKRSWEVRVYLGRGPAVLSRREKVKLKTIEGRRRLHLLAANGSTQMDQILS